MLKFKSGVISSLVVILGGFFMVVAIALVCHVNTNSSINEGYINNVKSEYLARGAIEQIAYEISKQVHHPGLSIPSKITVGMGASDWDISGTTSNKTITITEGELKFESKGPGEADAVYKNYNIDGKVTMFSYRGYFDSAAKHRGGILLGGGKIEITPFEIAIENYKDKEQDNIKYRSNLPPTNAWSNIQLKVDATNSPSSNPKLTLWVNNVMVFQDIVMQSYDDRSGINTDAINAIGLFCTHQGDTSFTGMTLSDLSDMDTVQSVTPVMDLSTWTLIGNQSNKIIEPSATSIKITSIPTIPSYVYLEYLPVDVSKKIVQLDYTCYYDKLNMYGGVLYMGRLIDINTTRIGVRSHPAASLPQNNNDSVQESPALSGLSAGVSHDIRIIFDDTKTKPLISLWVDGHPIMQDEEIQSINPSKKVIGFASDYNSSSYLKISNVVLQNAASGIYGNVHSYYNKVIPHGTKGNKFSVVSCGKPMIKNELYTYNVSGTGVMNYKGAGIDKKLEMKIIVDYSQNPAIIKILSQK